MAETSTLVTGATAGIGYEISRALARGGMSVVITSRDEQRGRVCQGRVLREPARSHVSDEPARGGEPQPTTPEQVERLGIVTPTSPFGAETVGVRPDRAASAASPRGGLIRIKPAWQRDRAAAGAIPTLCMVRRWSGVRVPASALTNGLQMPPVRYPGAALAGERRRSWGRNWRRTGPNQSPPATCQRAHRTASLLAGQAFEPRLPGPPPGGAAAKISHPARAGRMPP
jgi:hypothetical protein